MIRPSDKRKYAEYLVHIMFGVYATMWVEASMDPIRKASDRLQSTGSLGILLTSSLSEPRLWLGVLAFISLLCLWWWYTCIFLELARGSGSRLLILDLIVLASFSVCYRLWSENYAIFGMVFVLAMLIMLVRFQTTIAIIDGGQGIVLGRSLASEPGRRGRVLALGADNLPEYRALVIGRNCVALILFACVVGLVTSTGLSQGGFRQRLLPVLMVVLVAACICGTVYAWYRMDRAKHPNKNSPYFFGDNDSLFRVSELRALVRRKIDRNSLVQMARNGRKDAVKAMLSGFWPFVREFESIIDRFPFPAQILSSRFGRVTAQHKLNLLKGRVAEIRKEEGSHAAHWKRDAEGVGVTEFDQPAITEVERLSHVFSTEDPGRFFLFLAAAEMVAVELGDALTSSTRFNKLFPMGQWTWGEMHVDSDEHTTFHLEVDLDLARAFIMDDSVAEVMAKEITEQVLESFAIAADAIVKEHLGRSVVRIVSPSTTGVA